MKPFDRLAELALLIGGVTEFVVFRSRVATPGFVRTLLVIPFQVAPLFSFG